MRSQTASTLSVFSQETPFARIWLQIRSASRPIGATTRMESFRSTISDRLDQGSAVHRRSAGHHAVVLLQRFADVQSLGVHAVCADRRLVWTAPFLHDGDRLVNVSLVLEVAQEDDAVGEIADVDARLHGADESMLGEDEHRGDAMLAEVVEQLVKMQQEEALFGDGVEEA